MARIRRRQFLAATGALLAPLAALAQIVGRELRIAFLDDGSEDANRAHFQAFLKRLGQLGYSEGRNLAVEKRFAQGVTERLPALAAELVALKPDIIIASATPQALAAKRATSTIPIVFMGPTDPVAVGLVQSLARPGGNATGISNLAVEVGVKWIDMMREIIPDAKRLAYLSDTSNKGAALVFDELQVRARSLNLSIQFLDGRQHTRLEHSFETIVRERLDGFIVGAANVVFEHRMAIIEFAARQKLPVIYGRREYADAGGLLSYGVDVGLNYMRAAEYVHRIAQGAKPMDLPVERPRAVRLVLNLKAARAQGIAIPQTIRIRADELIE